jgi:hypothetical protein
VKNKKDEKWLDQMIAKATNLGKVQFDVQKWNQKYLLNESRESSYSYVKLKPYYNIWRFIMENKITRYSAAAVIFVAVSLILLNPFGALNRDGVVLANVQENLEKIETVVLRGRCAYTLLDDPNKSFEFDVTKYCSTKYGYAEKAYHNGKFIYHWSANIPKKLAIVVIPVWKKYLYYPLNDVQLKILEMMSPKGIVDLFLNGSYEELGRSKIDGIEVEGFEIRDLKFIESIPKFFCDVHEDTTHLWIGVEDLLPVKVEGDGILGKCLFTGFNDVRVYEAYTFESYDIELDEGIFDPNIPADYTPLDFGILSIVKAKIAKAGLFGVCMIPAGLIFWKRKRREKTATDLR